MTTLLTMELRYEHDVVSCRQRIRQIAECFLFDRQEQTRIATAVSEIARNTFEYAQGGKVEFSVDSSATPLIIITFKDSGPGIADLEKILSGQYVSTTGMGLGILGAKRLMEHFEISASTGEGTKVVLGKPLPKKVLPLTAQKIREVIDELAKKGAQNPFEEVQEQNQELMRALEEVQNKQLELARLNQELEETNRGVVALYAELDEKAESLKRASEAKTSFLSNMTHEFRTPLNSILGLSQAALSEKDGPLHQEQKKQLNYIHKSAAGLSELVNDLLDIAKVEAGRVEVRPSDFSIPELFGALRGVLRPLLKDDSAVSLVFESDGHLPLLHTDEGKLSQILRNLISNALKFSQQGEVKVSAHLLNEHNLQLVVRDQGIGIALHDQERIFEEFVQIENPLQKKFKGTGLGLSLSRKLAKLLGGELSLKSRPGQGSEFTVSIPLRYSSDHEQLELKPLILLPQVERKPEIKKQLKKILVIDDEEISRYVLRDLINQYQAQIIEAADGIIGMHLAAQESPELIFLDLQMPAMSGFYVLEMLKANPLTKEIPVIVHTAMTLTHQERSALSKQVLAIISKNSPSREVGRKRIEEALHLAGFNNDSSNDQSEVNYGHH